MQVNKGLKHPATVGCLIISAVFIGYFYVDTFKMLSSLWNDAEGDYGHGYLVILISLYLVYLKRAELATLPFQPSFLGILLICLVTFCWALSMIVSVSLVQGAGVVFIIAGLVWALFGTAFLKHLAVPILYLLFAVPIWAVLSVPLQNITTEAVYPLVRLFDIPALRDQYAIILPSGRLIIEEACSGLRYFLAAITLGALYAYLNFSTLSSRVFVIFLAGITAILANILRVFIIIKVAYESEMQHPWVNDHLMMGWVLFGSLMFFLLVIDVWLHKKKHVQIDGELNTTAPSLKHIGNPDTALVARHIPIIFMIPMALTLGPALVYQYQTEPVNPMTSSSIVIPTPATWVSEENAQLDWRPYYSGAVSRQIDFTSAQTQVSMYVGAYSHQLQGQELINQFNKVEGKENWRRQTGQDRVLNHNGAPLRETVLSGKDGQQLVVWYRYQVAGIATTSDYVAKIAQIWGWLAGNNTAFIFAYAVKKTDSEENARKKLGQFSDAMRWQDIVIHKQGVQ